MSVNMGDLLQHVVTFGMDIYPPVEIANVRTRLNMFYEEASERWPELFEKLVASGTEFKISTAFRRRRDIKGPSIQVDTFALTQRGPAFVFPLLLPEPVGFTGIDDRYVEEFQQVRRLFFSAIPDLQIMRLGLVRDIVLGTGETPCLDALTGTRSFAGADLTGGMRLLIYRDAKCNVRIELEPVQLLKTTKLPVGTAVTERQCHGLRVRLDVNNWDTSRPLEDADIEEVLIRATSLWPDELLKYINERSPS